MNSMWLAAGGNPTCFRQVARYANKLFPATSKIDSVEMADAIRETAADVAERARTVSKLVAFLLTMDKNPNPVGEGLTHAIGNKLQT